MEDQKYIFSVTEKLMELYGFFRQKWVMIYKIGDRPTKFWTKTEHLEGSMMQSHLEGKFSVGTFAGPRATKFISIDVDYNSPEVVHKIIEAMVDMGVPREKIYVSTSGRKGYHIDIFFRDKLYNNRARMFYILLIDRTGLDPRKVEFRPTDGQAIKVPLGVHLETGNRCWYLDRETLETIESFDEVFKIELIEEELINKIIDRLGNEYMKKLYSELREQREKVAGTKAISVPTDLNVTQPGTRHKLQVRVAIRARQRGANRSGVYYAQINWYNEQDHSLISSDDKEVSRDANYIADWVMNHVTPLQTADNVVVKEAPSVEITKADIPYILSAPTPTARKVALLIWIYCRRYGEAKLAMNTIMDKVGVSKTCINSSIKSLIDDHIIIKKPKTIDKRAAFYIKETNVYQLPKRLCRKVPDASELWRDSVSVNSWITDRTMDDVYYDTLAKLCKPSLLAKYLTKPELAECKKRMECEQNG